MLNAPTDHPPTCAGCHGCGWQAGPINRVTAHGQTVRTYTTVMPCGHHWIDDDPTPEHAIARDEYLARLSPDDPEFDRWSTIEERWRMRP
jgi:hypothetical protein